MANNSELFWWYIAIYDGNNTNHYIIEDATIDQLTEFFDQGGNADYDQLETEQVNACINFDPPTLPEEVDDDRTRFWDPEHYCFRSIREARHLIVDYSEHEGGKIVPKDPAQFVVQGGDTL